MSFVKQFCRILTSLGDIQQIRWTFQTALDAVTQITGTGADTADIINSKRLSGATDGALKGKALLQAQAQLSAAIKSSNSYFVAIKDEWELLEEFLNAELTLGQCGIKQLNLLRERRDKVRALLEESQRTRLGLNVNIGSSSISKDSRTEKGFLGLYDITYDLVERYDPSPLLQLPQKQQRQLSSMMLFGLEQFSSIPVRFKLIRK